MLRLVPDALWDVRPRVLPSRGFSPMVGLESQARLQCRCQAPPRRLRSGG